MCVCVFFFFPPRLVVMCVRCARGDGGGTEGVGGWGGGGALSGGGALGESGRTGWAQGLDSWRCGFAAALFTVPYVGIYVITYLLSNS